MLPPSLHVRLIYLSLPISLSLVGTQWGFILILGGFAYFDEHGTLLRVNAITACPSPNGIVLIGPRRANGDAVATLAQNGRLQPLALPGLRRAGFEAAGWIHPDEAPGGRPLLEDEEEGEEEDPGGMAGSIGSLADAKAPANAPARAAAEEEAEAEYSLLRELLGPSGYQHGCFVYTLAPGSDDMRASGADALLYAVVPATPDLYESILIDLRIGHENDTLGERSEKTTVHLHLNSGISSVRSTSIAAEKMTERMQGGSGVSARATAEPRVCTPRRLRRYALNLLVVACYIGLGTLFYMHVEGSNAGWSTGVWRCEARESRIGESGARTRCRSPGPACSRVASRLLPCRPSPSSPSSLFI